MPVDLAPGERKEERPETLAPDPTNWLLLCSLSVSLRVNPASVLWRDP